jgi:predicted transcriptional regulator
MELHLTPEQEQELSQVAIRKGRRPSELAQEVIGFYLQHEARFVDAVRRGLKSADRGDFVEHEEVLARVDRLFQS